MHCRPVFSAFQRAFREWMRVSLVSLDRMWPPVVTGWVWWTSKPVSSTDGAVNSYDAHYLFVPVLVVPASQNVWSALYVCGFWSRHDLWKKKAAERREREAGVLLLFEEDQEGGLAGVTGLGEGTQHAWESSSVAVWTEGYCPENLSEWLPWGPLPLSLPHHLSVPCTFSLFHSRPFFLDLFFPTETVSCVTISQTAFHATQTHILVSLSPLCLWPPSRRGLNSMHYVISVCCVHTAVRCRITIP